MTRTPSRCDRILDLIDACLADIENPSRGSGSTGSPASRNSRLANTSPA